MLFNWRSSSSTRSNFMIRVYFYGRRLFLSRLLWSRQLFIIFVESFSLRPLSKNQDYAYDPFQDFARIFHFFAWTFTKAQPPPLPHSTSRSTHTFYFLRELRQHLIKINPFFIKIKVHPHPPPYILYNPSNKSNNIYIKGLQSLLEEWVYIYIYISVTELVTDF